jgi:hypothetical protein
MIGFQLFIYQNQRILSFQFSTIAIFIIYTQLFISN